MHCPWASYNSNFRKLDEKWNHFSSSERLSVAEFNKLFQKTLEISLDVGDMSLKHFLNWISNSFTFLVPDVGKSCCC